MFSLRWIKATTRYLNVFAAQHTLPDLTVHAFTPNRAKDIQESSRTDSTFTDRDQGIAGTIFNVRWVWFLSEQCAYFRQNTED